MGWWPAAGKFRAVYNAVSDTEKGKEGFRNVEFYLEWEFTILTAFELCVRASSSAKRNS